MDFVPPRAVPADLRRAADHFAWAIDSAHACLRPVNSDMAVLQASWRGEGSVRLGQAMNDWERQFDAILTHLGELRDLVTNPRYCSNERSTGPSGR
ncbi:WXG100 family type VII secretion target [Amycolatopsis jiangsuensis]|uniref:WXG100 family type VII secretion target n=1 Tax=Amycolatopsis jiangsuensis TaxID=1181879 RepID=A0A840J3Y8_9PSEU|nr:WXG100 family type VII secretion target [Amycolatopsis jiangsuensis]MBB4688439.1 WXG100 family type VII secretion target [Amycolatopsis jiangsuensis]